MVKLTTLFRQSTQGYTSERLAQKIGCPAGTANSADEDVVEKFDVTMAGLAERQVMAGSTTARSFSAVTST